MGDSNARHVAWGDEFGKTYGESLQFLCRKFIVKSPNEHTFAKRHLNGGSVIDFCPCDFTLCKDSTDFEVEKDKLFTGASIVGYWPVFFSLLVSKPEKFTQKVLDYSKAE